MTLEAKYRAEFLLQCVKWRRARLPGSKALCIERAYDAIDLYLAWREMNTPEETACGDPA